MCHTMFPETKITTNHLEEQLKETTLEQHGNDLVKVFTDMEDLRLKIEAEKGHAYDTDRYMTLIFSKLENYKQPDFLFDLCAMAEVISSLKGTYKNLLVDKKWDKMDSSEEQIIALTTQVKQLKKAAPKVDGSGNNTIPRSSWLTPPGSLVAQAAPKVPSLLQVSRPKLPHGKSPKQVPQSPTLTTDTTWYGAPSMFLNAAR